MDEKKLLDKIKQKKEKQVDIYVNSIKKVVQRDPVYYKDRKYADKFKQN